ncbi:MAG: hypothetical protein AAGC55_26670, partial [Myxococcota bacterium]
GILYYFDPYEEEPVQLEEAAAKALGRYNRAMGNDGRVMKVEAWEEDELLYVEYPEVQPSEHAGVLENHRVEYSGVAARVVAPPRSTERGFLKLRSFYDARGQLERSEDTCYLSDPRQAHKVMYRNAEGSLEKIFEYEYDSRGLCILEKEYDGDGRTVEHVEVEYDDDGNEYLRREIYADGTSFTTETA